jgi:hypothetical protein
MNTQRFNQNANFMGSMGSGGGNGGSGEVSDYQSMVTNRIISNNLIGTGGDQIGGGGYWSTATNPMATMRVVSTDMTGNVGMNNMGGYIAETIQNIPTYRQTQNFDYGGPIQTANSTEATATGEAERNMFFRDDKEALLYRNDPTPVNAYQGPTPESMYSMNLKNLPSVEMLQMGSSATTDYLPFSSKLKNIQIPTTYPNFNPADMVYGNPYVNNIALQSMPNIQNSTVGYAGINTGPGNNTNTNGVFYQRSQDQMSNYY